MTPQCLSADSFLTEGGTVSGTSAHDGNVRWKRHLGPLVCDLLSDTRSGKDGARGVWRWQVAGGSGSLGLVAETGEGPGLALTLLTPDTQHRLKIHHLLFWRRKKPSSPRIDG